MRYATKSAQVLLGLAFLGAGGQKLAGADHMADELRRYGYPRWSMHATGAVEAGGALGMLLGLRRRALVPAAGLLLSATMVGALATHLTTHLRLGESARDMAPPAALRAMSAAVLAAPRAGRGGAR